MVILKLLTEVATGDTGTDRKSIGIARGSEKGGNHDFITLQKLPQKESAQG
jgi:hypothetical protein